MGFAWTPITQGVTKIIDDHIDEVQAAINTVYTDYGLAPFAWVELPVNADDFITNAQFQEIRDALDFAHGSRCVADDDVVDAGDDVTVDDSEDTGVHDGEDTTVEDGRDVSILDNQNTGIDTGQYSGMLSGQVTGRLSGQVTGFDGGLNVSYHEPEHGTVG